VHCYSSPPAGTCRRRGPRAPRLNFHAGPPTPIVSPRTLITTTSQNGISRNMALVTCVQTNLHALNSSVFAKRCAWSLNLELTGLGAPPFPTRGSPSATNSATNSVSRQRRQAFPPALEPDLALLPCAEALPCNADPVCPVRRTWHMKTVVYRMSITALPHTSSVLCVTLRNRGQVHFSLPLCCHDGIPKTRS
jgi:hypothetical protein